MITKTAVDLTAGDVVHFNADVAAEVGEKIRETAATITFRISYIGRSTPDRGHTFRKATKVHVSAPTA